MNIYRITFSAHWMGGTAIVRAATHDDAVLMLSKHHRAEQVKKPESASTLKPFDVKCIQQVAEDANIIYYYDGDY